MKSVVENTINIKSLYSVYFLIAANLIPLFGVLFYEWNLLYILLIYWAESAVVGFFNVIRMLKINPLASVFAVPFFIFHFGMFMFVHLVFIVTLTSFPGIVQIEARSGNMFEAVKIGTLLIPIAALFVSHGFSLITNFFGRKEYERRNINEQMMIPYKRIVVMHLTLLFGAFIIFPTGQPMFLIALLTIIKTIVDLMAHLQEHLAAVNLLIKKLQTKQT